MRGRVSDHSSAPAYQSREARSSASTRALIPLSAELGRRILEAIIGEIVSATRLEIATAAAMVRANSANRRPMSPSVKAIGTKTEISTIVVAMTAKPTWRVPSKAATSAVSRFSSMRRWMFSSTTMLSSTTRPMASTRASRVSRLIEKPRISRRVKLAVIEMGTVTAGTSIARILPRKARITSTTSTMAMASVL